MVKNVLLILSTIGGSWVMLQIALALISRLDQTLSTYFVEGPLGDCGGCNQVITFDPQTVQPIGTPQRFENMDITVLDIIPIEENERRVAGYERWDVHVLFRNRSTSEKASLSPVGDQIQDNQGFYNWGEILDGSRLASGRVVLLPNEQLEVTYTYWVPRNIQNVYWIYYEHLIVDGDITYADQLVVFDIKRE